jgi:hypothetical protein
MRFGSNGRTIAAGFGFGLAVVDGKLKGYNINVAPGIKANQVWAGAVAVYTADNDSTAFAFVRRPSPQLEAMCHKFNALARDFYTIQSVSVSDRAIGIVGLTAYGPRLFVVGYAGLPHESQDADLIVATGDETFSPTEGHWFLHVKSPFLWTVTTTPSIAGRSFIFADGWKAPFLPYQGESLEWQESEPADAIGTFGEYKSVIFNEHINHNFAETKFQRRYMPNTRLHDVEIGHQCGIGRDFGNNVYFWGTRPEEV